ncbi:ionotropic receptor 68b [Musca autumnalis]|uniref:ionotropic receptor 68b n=1 Tax=Musca autumnalis TaxID=221902 RepID=UPI003CF569B0
MEAVYKRINVNFLHQCMAELPTTIRNLDTFRNEPERFRGSLNIFFITSARIAQKVVAFLNPRQRWKQGHRYLFVWLLEGNNKMKLLGDFFQHIWQRNILHAVAVLNSQLVYTFEPFSLEGFRLRRLDTNQNYFYDKLKNFHHFEIRITMFIDPVRAVPLPNYTTQGYKRIDGRVANALVKYLNATARYITPSDNETYGSLVNGTFTGSLKDIHSGLTHIGFNLRYTLDHVKQHIEELYPYQRRFLYLVVPAAKLRPEYLIFVKAFSNSLWRLLLLNFALILLLFMLLQYLVGRLPSQHIGYVNTHTFHWYELLEMFWKTQLGHPVEGFARISSLRQFLIAWILFSYVLTSMYFAKVESNFVQPAFEPEIDSLEQLPQLNLPIYAFDVVFEAVKFSLKPKYYEWINAHGVRVPRNIRVEEFAFTVTQKNADVALMLHDEMAKELLAHSYNDVTKRPSYHIVKEYLRSLTSSYIMTKGSPFIHKFQSVISAFHEFGLMRHWLQLESQPNTYTHKSEEFFEDLDDDFDLLYDEDGVGGVVGASSVSATSHKKVVLNLEILQGAFYLWLAGILISLVGFVAEWLYWWHQNEKRIHIM